MSHSRIRRQGTTGGTESVVVVVVVVVAVAVYVLSTMTTSCFCAIRLVLVRPVVDSAPVPMPPKDQTTLEVVDQSVVAAAVAVEGIVIAAVEIACDDSGSGSGFALETVENCSTCLDFVPTMRPDLKIPAGRAYPVHPQTKGSVAAAGAAAVQVVGAAEPDVPS